MKAKKGQEMLFLSLMNNVLLTDTVFINPVRHKTINPINSKQMLCVELH